MTTGNQGGPQEEYLVGEQAGVWALTLRFSDDETSARASLGLL